MGFYHIGGIFLGPIRLEPTKGDIGRPYYLARTTINALAILEPPPSKGGGPNDGSNSLRWWRRRESNPRPKTDPRKKMVRRQRLEPEPTD